MEGGENKILGTDFMEWPNWLYQGPKIDFIDDLWLKKSGQIDNFGGQFMATLTLYAMGGKKIPGSNSLCDCYFFLVRNMFSYCQAQPKPKPKPQLG